MTPQALMRQHRRLLEAAPSLYREDLRLAKAPRPRMKLLAALVMWVWGC
jgi:hypothetical protein